MIKRHHPNTVISKIYSQIRYSIIPLAAFVYNEIRAGTGQQPTWVYLGATIYGVVTGGWSILSWFKETYKLDSKVLLITKGVFTVTQRAIPSTKEHHVTRKEIMMQSMSSNTFWLGLPVTITVIQQGMASSIRRSWWERIFRIYELELDINSPANVREYRLSGVTKRDCDEILKWYKNKKLKLPEGV